MKNILIVVTILISQNLLGQTTPTLEVSMKALGQQFGVIAKQVLKEGKVDVSTLEAIDQLQLYIADSSLVVPALANTPALEIEYRSLMSELMRASVDLRSSVKMALKSPAPADLAPIKEVLTNMNAIKSKGHGKFIPDTPAH